MKIFNDTYIWKLYDEMCELGRGTIKIPETSYRLKEIEAYKVMLQVEQLHATRSGELKSKWVDTGEVYKVNVLNSSEWDAMFDESDIL